MTSDAIIKLTDRCDGAGNQLVSLSVLWMLFKLLTHM